MARPDLRKGCSAGLLFHMGTGLLRSLGDRSLPVSLSILELALVSYPRARMVPRNRHPRHHFPPNHHLDRLNHPGSPTASWASNVNLPGVDECSPRHDRWDLEVREGRFGGCRLLLATQSYGTGKQLLRYRIVPRYSGIALAICALFAVISIGAWMSGNWIPSMVSGFLAGLLIARTILDAGFAAGRLRNALKGSGAS